MISYRTSNGQPWDVPTEFVIGSDGMCYAKLPNEYEAEEYMYEFGGVSFACVDGYLNGVLLHDTIGM